MMKIILDNYIIYVLMGCAAVLGIVCKLIVGIVLKRLVRAAGSMSKSSHPFMRLVRAKFEHTCMISDRVENVGVFVDKYLYEYKVAGIRLHTLRRMELFFAAVCFGAGLAGVLLEYLAYGVREEMYQIGATGLALAVAVCAVHFITDEKYRLQAVKNYMVDYLENICLRRYEKKQRREVREEENLWEQPEERTGRIKAIREAEESEDDSWLEFETEITDGAEAEKSGAENKTKHAAEDVTGRAAEHVAASVDKAEKNEPEHPETAEEIPAPKQGAKVNEPAVREPAKTPGVKTPVRAAKAEKPLKNAEKDAEQNESKEVLIRQILEEFMA